MRYPGLAHGWEGTAWTTLQRIRIGAVAPRGFVPRLARRLAATVDGDRDAGPAQLIGIGGAAVVAVLAVEHEQRLASLAKRAVERWTATTCDPARDDVILGHPGALLALGELVDLAPRFRPPRRFVARAYRRTLAAVRRMVDSDRPHYLGLAHGLAGLLLAAECAVARLGRRRDDALVSRAVDRLANARVIAPGVGTLWTPTTEQRLDQLARGWCHGTPGIALALSLCHALSGDRSYAQLFDEAAPTLALPGASDLTFCCGRAGRAQILVELYRQRGESRWLDAARAVAVEPARARLGCGNPRGFNQGSLGLAYLNARLAAPSLPLPATGFGRYRA
jgi:serine/threonine-protein kinase